MQILKTFGTSILAFALLDLIWLGFVIKPFNMRQLAEIGRFENGEFQMLYGPAVIVYILMALTMACFVMPKISADSSWLTTFGTGALLGLCVYGVFDMTNLAILKNYPVAFAAVDMAWGSFAYGAVALITKTVRDL